MQLTTAAIAPGTVQVSQVFAQQAKAAGVNVDLKAVTATDLFGPNFLKWSFAQDNWAPTPFFTQVGEGQVPGAPFNESHFDDASSTRSTARPWRRSMRPSSGRSRMRCR